ncbi:unnamed protein product [Discosporangium mesarthrocarpum]
MVVSYNVLANSLIDLTYIPYCRGWGKEAWEARPRRTVEKVLEFSPDVVCLQEVDEDMFHSLYTRRLAPFPISTATTCWSSAHPGPLRPWEFDSRKNWPHPLLPGLFLATHTGASFFDLRGHLQ